MGRALDPQTAYKIGADKLWYWFGLRGFNTIALAPSLADAHRRQQWLMEQKAFFRLKQPGHLVDLAWPQTPVGILFSGKKELSNWDDRDRLKFVREQNSFPRLRAQKGAQDAGWQQS